MRALALSALFALGFAAPAAAQRAPAVDFRAGWAGFADESTVHHSAAGAAIRFPVLGNRVSLGPEIFFMAGPGRDRDLFLSAVLVTNLRGQSHDRPVAVMPYFIASAGLMWHRSQFEWIDEWYRTQAAHAGFGVRARVTDRIGLSGEARVGTGLELRLTGGVTWTLR